MPIPIENVNCGSFSMDYFRFGTGKIPFVILPGLSVQTVMVLAGAVAKMYASFGADCTVYVFDRRKELPERYPVVQAAHDTAEAIEKLGLADIFLFGASQGGMMAMKIAIEYPELVRKLVLGSTSCRITKEQYRAPARWIALAKAGKREELYLSFGREIYPLNVFEQEKDVLIEASKHVTDADLNRFITLAEGIKDFSAGDPGKIICPVLVTGSADDAVLGAEAYEEIQAKLKGNPNAQFRLYNGYGHASFDTVPDYRDQMLRFLLS